MAEGDVDPMRVARAQMLFEKSAAMNAAEDAKDAVLLREKELHDALAKAFGGSGRSLTPIGSSSHAPTTSDEGHAASQLRRRLLS